jgi:site-specific DNA-cytosine methylase
VRVYKAGFFFCGAGPGAIGTLRARAKILGKEARFESVGGIDNDLDACRDFEKLTRSRALCCDIRECTPAMLRDLMGDDSPDMVLASPPCQGFSRLISKEKAKSPFYQELNRLVVVWLELMIATWDEPPALILLENVEGITSRGKDLLTKVRKLLRGAAYVINESTHDAGEFGGLAQHRSRFLLVARRPKRVPSLLYTPPKQRVRGCGEVLADLPLPNDPKGGRLHALPGLTPNNWLRLCLIPAGGDHRSLPGVLADGQARREVFAKYKITPWDEATPTVAGSGTNGIYGVADPRVKSAYDKGYGVLAWDQASPTVAGGSSVGQGAYAVADPRFTCMPRSGAYGVADCSKPTRTITGHHKVDNATACVADPRVTTPDAAEWLGSIDWSRENRRALERAPVLIARDGTWHRPFTLLDLAVLQDMPWQIDGEPLDLSGRWLGKIRRRIGNAIPVGAMTAVATKMLVTLLGSDMGAFSLSGDAVWVEGNDTIEPGRAEVGHG